MNINGLEITRVNFLNYDKNKKSLSYKFEFYPILLNYIYNNSVKNNKFIKYSSGRDFILNHDYYDEFVKIKNIAKQKYVKNFFIFEIRILNYIIKNNTKYCGDLEIYLKCDTKYYDKIIYMLNEIFYSKYNLPLKDFIIKCKNRFLLDMSINSIISTIREFNDVYLK